MPLYKTAQKLDPLIKERSAMKYFSVVLLTLLLLGGCSTDGRIVSSNSPTETTSSDSKLNDATSVDKVTATPEGAAEDSTNNESEATDDPQIDKAKADLEGVDQKNVALVVSDQDTAGQIIIAKVSTARDGWISIHKSSADGGIQLPDSIGQARVDSGDSEKVIVDLWDAPYAGEKLWALLHIDAGDRGTYEFPEKDLAVRKNGETMARSFKIKEKDKEEAQE